jgi:hypothetical protein
VWKAGKQLHKFNQYFVVDVFLFIIGNIPEQTAVFSDKGFYFRAVHIESFETNIAKNGGKAPFYMA